MMGIIKEKNRKLGGSKKEKLRLEGFQKRLECMKEHNIGQSIDNSKIEYMLAIKENEKNAQKYGALCDSYMVKG